MHKLNQTVARADHDASRSQRRRVCVLTPLLLFVRACVCAGQVDANASVRHDESMGSLGALNEKLDAVALAQQRAEEIRAQDAADRQESARLAQEKAEWKVKESKLRIEMMEQERVARAEAAERARVAEAAESERRLAESQERDRLRLVAASAERQRLLREAAAEQLHLAAAEADLARQRRENERAAELRRQERLLHQQKQQEKQDRRDQVRRAEEAQLIRDRDDAIRRNEIRMEKARRDAQIMRDDARQAKDLHVQRIKEEQDRLKWKEQEDTLRWQEEQEDRDRREAQSARRGPKMTYNQFRAAHAGEFGSNRAAESQAWNEYKESF